LQRKPNCRESGAGAFKCYYPLFMPRLKMEHRPSTVLVWITRAPS
jgi:hypothetical protein